MSDRERKREREREREKGRGEEGGEEGAWQEQARLIDLPIERLAICLRRSRAFFESRKVLGTAPAVRCISSRLRCSDPMQ